LIPKQLADKRQRLSFANVRFQKDDALRQLADLMTRIADQSHLIQEQHSSVTYKPPFRFLPNSGRSTD
jgi:hypothetical protein